jgi:hypothetical protein
MRFGIHFESAIKAVKVVRILLILHTLVYTIGGTRSDLELIKNYRAQLVYIIISFIIRWLVTFTTKFRPSLSWFKTMNLD